MSNTSSFWFQGEAAPDGPTIGQSLRFRNGQELRRASTPAVGETWTVSFWTKLGEPPGTNQSDFYWFNFGQTNSVVNLYMDNYTSNPTQNYRIKNAGGSFHFDGLYRDYSAWYHIVWSNVPDTDPVGPRMWVNGEQVCNPQGVPFNITAGQFTIGANNDAFSATKSSNFEGYQADWYFIDGQALEPNAFGEYDQNDVWVPREVSFAYAQMRYSDFVTTDTGSYYASTTGPEKMFDGRVLGSDPIYTQSNNSSASSWIEWKPVPGVDYDSKVEVWFGAGNSVSLNGGANQTGPTPADWFEIATGSGKISSIKFTGPYGGTVRGIRVDGKILTNPFIWSDGVTLIADPPGQFDHPRTNMFDGDTSTNCIGNTSGQTISWVPPEPITYNQSVEIWTPSADGSNTISLHFEGAEIASVPCVVSAWTSVATGTGTFDNLRIFGPSTDARVSAVRIDGQIYVDGVNNSYGPNGFHLDFSDPNDIGKDVSGNGNDFTATGFNMDYSPPPEQPYKNFGDSSVFQIPSGGEIPNPDGSGVYWTGTPDGANINYNDSNGAKSGLGQGVTGAHVYATNRYIYGTGTQANNSTWGNWESLTFSFKDYPTVTKVRVFGYGGDDLSGSVGLYPAYDIDLLDGSGTVISTRKAQHSPLGTGFGYPQDWWNLDVPEGSNPRSIRFSRAGSGQYRIGIGRIEINDELQLQGGIANPLLDLMQDSPSQNYATLNPLDCNQTSNLKDANLTQFDNTSVGGFLGVPGTQKVYSGKFYWEVAMTNVGSVANTATGITFNSLLGRATSGGVGTETGEVGYHPNGNINVEGTTEQNVASFGDGDLIGVAIDCDANPPTITFFKNGTQQGIPVDFYGVEHGWTPMLGMVDAYDSSNSINAGQQPFAYIPPEGFKALQTQNHRNPPILNGREHFQAITTGTGSGKIYRQGQIDITSPFVADPAEEVPWRDSSLIDYVGVVTLDGGQVFDNLTIWSVSTGSGLEIYISEDGTTWTNTGSTSLGTGVQTYSGPARYIRYGNGGGTWQADYFVGVGTLDILGYAQNTFPDGLWWIKDRVNSNQHQLVSSVNGTTHAITSPETRSSRAYVAPTGNSVAWCWNCPDEFTPTCSETLVSARRNADAGFSMVRITGTASGGGGGADETFEHGLNSPPEFVIIQQIIPAADTSACRAWSSELNAGNTLWLNFTNDQQSENQLVPTSTNDTLVNYLGSALTSGDIVFFNFAPVPGYSAFGSYEGNSDTSGDGPFIYTGFRPAWVMIKCSSINATNWVINDSTRSIVNPVDLGLQANEADGESSSQSFRLDFLSNGFKVRSTGSGADVNRGTLIYAAFAENPFSYPVTAR